ncbi:hypothetical protein [Bradyrhizobium sp. AUGA SZCCT0283]|uniref:hypothetical protein n=1 Tax=Bradyrhizobium sp. AUGA SZCCT0283 TaxID=2807671 RepID=UPI001BAC076A|nr:hypothetical protein [Bradyrhizobium sp. AUGA SZCCT0283]MBR1277413.1 hypothetical protein [Bradyrhizobium sp. AUGA SZCCT0283]
MFATTHLTSRALHSAAASILLMAGLTSGAHAAAANAQISGNGFSPTILKVVSENGTSWTKIEGSTVGLPVTVHIGMPGYPIVNYKVRQLGQPNGQYFVNVSPDKHHDDQVDFSTTYEGSTDYMTAAEKQAIIATCNSKLGEGKGIRESHNTFGAVGVELTASFLTPSKDVGPLPSGGLGEPHKATANVSVPVKCEGKHGAADDVAAKEPNFGVKGIHLRFMTTAGYPTRPNPATKCQLTEAKVRLETSKAGGVKFRLWTKVGNEPMQNQFVEAWSKFVGPGKFEANFTKTFTVDKTTTVQAMAEDLTNPIGQSTGWKEVKLDCTGAGGGGLSGTPGNANPDSLPQATPKAPRPVVPGVAVGTKVAPVPPRTTPQLPPRFGQIKTAPMPMPHAVAAKDRFYPSKIRVN